LDLAFSKLSLFLLVVVAITIANEERTMVNAIKYNQILKTRGYSLEQSSGLIEVMSDMVDQHFLSKDDLVVETTKLSSETTQLGVELRAEMKEMGAEIRAEMKEMAAELRSEMHQMGTEIRAEMKEMGAELTGEIKRLDGKIDAQTNKIIIRLGAFMLALSGTIVAVIVGAISYFK
jgi:predicted amino acid-binding ACT domain protein